MLDPHELISHFDGSPLAPVATALVDATRAVLHQRRHGDFDRWLDLLDALPPAHPTTLNLDNDRVTIGGAGDLDPPTRTDLEEQLRSLHPWRKGPFDLFGIVIDSEWRSDWKWRRLEQAISPLKERVVADIGCGNGYYIFRMLGRGAAYVLGLDPSQLFIAQFNAIRHYVPETQCEILPLRCEELPFEGLEKGAVEFDTVFSMGVLYHRRDQMSHLQELGMLLRDGGELVLETLVIEPRDSDWLYPERTYAKMPNVRGIPTVPLLEEMLADSGFMDIEVVDVTVTSREEQRRTSWMSFESLADFLDPGDAKRTIEGYPAPMRAVLVCTKA